MTNLQKKFKQHNLTLEFKNNRPCITSGSGELQDKWFIHKFNRKLILFHHNRYKSAKSDHHKQDVCYSYDEIIKTITEHDKNRKYRSRMDELYNAVESGNIPKMKII